MAERPDATLTLLPQVLDAIVRLADSVDRLTALAEDLAEALGRSEWYGADDEEPS